MRSISAALSAGYSPENAVREAAEELRHLYGEREVVVREFQLMVQKLNMNRPIETVLTEAADELGMLLEVELFLQRILRFMTVIL